MQGLHYFGHNSSEVIFGPPNFHDIVQILHLSMPFITSNYKKL